MPSMQAAMQPRSPYLRLMRMHQPVGIWLVYWPCVWAMCLAALHDVAAGNPQQEALMRLALYIPLFFLGAVATRSAGCIINDMADREFDKHVERTKNRPLASGELTMPQAFIALAVMATLSLAVLLVLLSSLPADVSPQAMWTVTLPVLALITAYPFMKRITWWPQAFLGLTFNWGVLIGWLAMEGTLDAAAWWLYAASFFWTLAYDTIYGHQDKRDDERIGVKSTSRHLEKHSKRWIGSFYGGMVALLVIAAYHAAISLPALIGLALLAAGAAAVQLRLWQPDIPANCMVIFKSHVFSGAVIAAWLLTMLGAAFV